MDAKPKILIVDDRLENLVTLERLLANTDAEIVRALSGNEALAALLEHEFALALIDIEMPGMDGYETVELIRQDKKTKYLPIIFISAIYSENYHLIKGVESGAVDFITKPLIPDIIKGKVEIFLEIYKQRIELENYAEKMKNNNEELIQMNAKLEESEIQLKELNANKDKFFSIIAHDLKNPFNSLIGYSEVIINKFEDLDEQDKIDIFSNINIVAKQTYGLLENLLEWSLVQIDQIRINPSNFNLFELVEEMTNFLSPSAYTKNVILLNKIDNSLNVFADKIMIATVIRNIVTNAIKFSDSTNVVTLFAEKNNSLIKVSIKDNGIGISPDKVKNLFTIGKNKNQKGTRNEKGTGLGLILCKDFIERNNGEIFVESELGIGSKISFTIPESN